MKRKGLVFALAAVALLLLLGMCLGRPPWPGAGREDKNRTPIPDSVEGSISEPLPFLYYTFCGDTTSAPAQKPTFEGCELCSRNS
ncbi:MAG: hypothetical protein GF388_11405 [Candidatus Aegiribacteria sp.]|nr:hypothetical protein [Candidatus Aegiribacteria sp.]